MRYFSGELISINVNDALMVGFIDFMHRQRGGIVLLRRPIKGQCVIRKIEKTSVSKTPMKKNTGISTASFPAETKALIELLGIVTQEEKYKPLVREKLSIASDYQIQKTRLEIGFFNGQHLLLLIRSLKNDGSISLSAVNRFLQKLIEWSLVTDFGLVVGDEQLRYRWQKERITRFISLGIIDNVLLGPSYLPAKYQSRVPPIFVKKRGQEDTGTGFLTVSLKNPNQKYIVTAKHVVDPKDGIEFLSIGPVGTTEFKTENSDWIFHEEHDLAAMPVELEGNVIPIFLSDAVGVLTRTVTLGYPRVATTKQPYMLAHGGEVNAIIDSYFGDRCILISNLVAPGNSGGPVLNEVGLCVGMVIKTLETKHEGGVYPTNAALPSSELSEFIESI